MATDLGSCTSGIAPSILLNQWVEYNTTTDVVVDHGINYFNDSMEQFTFGTLWYSQINDTTMFTIAGKTLSVFDLQSLTFHKLETTSPISDGCIASSEIPSPRLFVNNKYDLAVLEIHTMEWIDDAPSTTYEHYQHTCIVVTDFLYTIGGFHKPNSNSIVESVSTDVTGNEWEVVANLANLTTDIGYIAWAGVTSVGRDIYIVGGGYGGNYHLTNHVYIFNTETRSIKIGAFLPEKSALLSMVTVNDIIYGFGGTVDRDGCRNMILSYESTN